MEDCGPDDGSVVVECDPVDLGFLADSGRNVLFEMRCQISRNNQDFSVGGSVSSLYHCFSPVSVEPCCCYVVSTLETYLSQHPNEVGGNANNTFDREVIVRGESFLPVTRLPVGASVEVHIAPTVSVPKAEDEPEAPPLVLPVVCDSTTKLRFTLTLSALKLLQTAMCALGADQLPLRLAFFLRTVPTAESVSEKVVSLSQTSLFYSVCRDCAVRISPNNLKRAALADRPQEVSIVRQDGTPFTFSSTNVQVRLHFSAGSEERASILLKRDSVSMVEAAADGAEPQFLVHALIGALESHDEAASRDLSSLSSLFVSLSLDGHDEPAEATWDKLCFYTSLAAYTAPAPPKGGFVGGASISLTLQEYCRPVQNSCKVRLRGVNEALAIEAAATLLDSGSSSVVQFTLPPEALKLDVVMNGKEKLLFVDVSIDAGVTYDKAESAMLQIK